MPWCETCSRFFNPPSLADGGACPSCGRVLAGGVGESAAAEPLPWHFKVLLAAVVVYLAVRAWQGVAWVAGLF